MAEQGRELPGYVRREFEDFLQCGRLEHGFLRVRCESCYAEHLVAFSCKRRGFCPSCGARRMAESAALLVDIVYRAISTHLINRAGYSKQTARTGAVTLIQRFGSALNLNIHFHMLFLAGVYVDGPDGAARFRGVRAPTTEELTQLSHTIAHRVGRFLERQGLLERDAENSYLSGGVVQCRSVILCISDVKADVNYILFHRRLIFTI
jgi:hypothetical protein